MCCATGASSAARAGGNTGTKPMLSSLASVLNLSTSQIQQDRSNGQSLSQIASTLGVSQSKLLSTIESSLQNGPVGPSITSDQLTDLATTIAHNPGTFPRHRPRHRTRNLVDRRRSAVDRCRTCLEPRQHMSYKICPSWPTTKRDRKHECSSARADSQITESPLASVRVTIRVGATNHP